MACPCCNKCPCGQARNSSGTCVAFSPSIVAVAEWAGKTLPQPGFNTLTWQDPDGAGSTRPNTEYSFQGPGLPASYRFKTVGGVCYMWGLVTTVQVTSEPVGEEANDCTVSIVWEWRVDASNPAGLAGNTYAASVVFNSGQQRIGFNDQVELTSANGVCIDGIPSVTVTFAP